tara:strand:+ start:1 stop:1806 length:1806 start_codon:yes stop_codon:yes gene_type:complete
MKNFMGKDGFTWFVGVVEDRKDPKFLGRLKVRILGYHTEDKEKLPTADLPWAHVMNPITSATVSGIGQTPLGAVEGTWIVGFFTDGEEAQMPMIIGTLPGRPTKTPTGEKGFEDPNAAYPREANQSDVNRLAINTTEDVPDLDAVGGGNQVVEFNGGDANDAISISNRNSPVETLKVAQFQADLDHHLREKGFSTDANSTEILKAANDFKKNYHKIFKLPADVLKSKDNILTGAANHVDTVITKTINHVKGTDTGTLLKDSILVNAKGQLFTPGNLSDVLPKNLSVDAIAKGVQNISSYNIKDLSTTSLEKLYALAPDKVPGNLIKGIVDVGKLKHFKSPLKSIQTNPHLSSVLDSANLTKNIGVAQIDGIADGIPDAITGLNTLSQDIGLITADFDVGLTGGAWSEPPSPYAAEYPFNHVYESESGHIMEYDDTADAERIHQRHMSGSGYEIGPKGTKVTKVVKDNYEIISNDDFLHVRGTRRQTVDEGVRIRCNATAGVGNSYSIEVGVGSNCNIEVNGGNVNVVAKGVGVGGDINLNAMGNINMKAAGSINMAAVGAITEAAVSRTSRITGLNVNNAGVFDVNATQSTISAPLGIFLN